MFHKVRNWLHRRGVIDMDSIHLDGHQTQAGESLDDEIDAIRQTQMIDPSRLHEASAPQSSRAAASKPPAYAHAHQSSPEPRGDSKTPLYQPTLRGPIAFLAALDDGSLKEAELVRLHGGKFVIGRDAGDMQFPHEVLMSGRHGQVERRETGGEFSWHYTDLESRNGSFFRVEQAYLRDGQEFLLGSYRFAFQMPLPDGSFQDHSAGPSSNDDAGQDDPAATQLVAPAGLTMPKLVYRGPHSRQDTTVVLDRPQVVIGRDQATCVVTIEDDPYLCENHARVHHTSRGWLLEDLGSRNGTWLRLHEAKLSQPTEFQLGEQRFYFRPHRRRPG